jgi:hypothetical protein
LNVGGTINETMAKKTGAMKSRPERLTGVDQIEIGPVLWLHWVNLETMKPW